MEDLQFKQERLKMPMRPRSGSACVARFGD